jgi:DNA modification methylase
LPHFRCVRHLGGVGVGRVGVGAARGDVVVSAARILVGDVRQRLQELPDGSVQCVVTSPPYWGLRDYGHEGQIGLEQTPDEYVAEMVAVFREVRRVLTDDGTLWLNLGDSYARSAGPEESKLATTHTIGVGYKRVAEGGGAPHKKNRPPEGLKPKDLVGIPWRVAFALQADGWWLRQDIIWAKPNPMPESVTDRCTKAHEYVFLLTKSAQYFYDAAAIKEESADPIGSAKRYESDFGGSKNTHLRDTDQVHTRPIGSRDFDGTRNKRSVWTITTKPYSGAHFAVMPMALVEPCILAGSERLDTVLDPFCGSGTVGVVALRNQRKFIGIELNKEYADLAEMRIYEDGPLFNEVVVA